LPANELAKLPKKKEKEDIKVGPTSFFFFFSFLILRTLISICASLARP